MFLIKPTIILEAKSEMESQIVLGKSRKKERRVSVGCRSRIVFMVLVEIGNRCRIVSMVGVKIVSRIQLPQDAGV